MPDLMIQTAADETRLDAVGPLTRRLLRGDAAGLGAAFGIDLPAGPCRASAGVDDRSALWLGPDEWLLLAPLGTEWPDWDNESGAAVDIGHRQVALLLRGAHVEDVLAIGCPLDLSLRAFPVGSCTRTVFGKAEIVLWRRDEDAFHIEVWRSMSAYVRGLLEISLRDVR